MIKEYIEDLPGGEKFILAERAVGVIIGTILGGITGLIAGLIPMKAEPASVNDAVVLAVSMFALFLLIVVALGVAAYYYHLNRADKIYTERSKKI